MLVSLAFSVPASADRKPVYHVVKRGLAKHRWIKHSSHRTEREASIEAAQLKGSGRAHDTRVVPDLRRTSRQVTKILKENDFTIGRGRREYEHLLGGTFRKDSRRWRSGERILDAGAGQAGFFRDLLDDLGDRAPKLVAVAENRPRIVGVDDPYRHIEYVEGLLGDGSGRLEASLGHGSFDAIVDVFGPSHYSRRLDRVLAGYGKLLRRGGRAYLHMEPSNLFIDRNGAEITVLDYLRSIRGMKVSASKNARGGLSIVLTRTRRRLRVPELKLDDYFYFVDEPPPMRAYSVVE